MGVQVFVTVGTSALEKFAARKSPYHDIEVLIRNLEVLRDNSDLYNQQKTFMITQIKNVLSTYCATGPASWWAYTAELGSLLAMKREGKLSGNPADNYIFLFHSETVAGKLCAEVVAESIRNASGDCQMVSQPNQVQIQQVNGLRVDNADTFKNSLENLDRMVSNSLQDNSTYYFNITGGFKALIPFATVIAWDHNMKICYLFDKAEKLIIIDLPKNKKQTRVFPYFINGTTAE